MIIFSLDIRITNGLVRVGLLIIIIAKLPVVAVLLEGGAAKGVGEGGVDLRNYEK